MRSERLSFNLRITTDDCVNLHANRRAVPDARRLAILFSFDGPGSISIHSGDPADKEHDVDFDHHSQWEFVSAPGNSPFASRVASVTDLNDGSFLSAAEKIAAGYRAIHGTDHAPQRSTTEIKEKGPSLIPDNRRWRYASALLMDMQSTKESIWMPKPDPDVRHDDQHELVQAQSEAIAMMQNAGLNPTDQIQCRRHGCANVLRNVEALKYHLHIHNIADKTAPRNYVFPCASPKTCEVERGTSHLHPNAKTSPGMQHGSYMSHFPPRKLSIGSLSTPHFSPRKATPEVEHVPSLTTVAKAFISNPSLSKLTNPVREPSLNETIYMRAATTYRIRRQSKTDIAISTGAECDPNTILASSSASPDIPPGCPALTSWINPPVQPVSSPIIGGNVVSISDGNENAQSAFKMLTGLRSPTKALSSPRFMSPIRNGFKRVLSIGRSADLTDK